MSTDAFQSPWIDVAHAFARGGTAAFLPFGALEQHGPHLPLGTDTITAQHIAMSLAEHYDGVLLPPIHYGDTWNNAGYPGTVSLRPETVTSIAIDIGEAVRASGAAALVIVNGDWGNRQPLYSATRALLDSGFATLTLDYPGMNEAIGEVCESAPAAPGLHHAEEAETSIMMALQPSWVHRDRLGACYPAFPADFGVRPMKLDAYSESGIFGDSRPSTAEKGEHILAATRVASIQVLDAFFGAMVFEK
ncbi:creatininase family protein (plasmid) [Coraliomargarita sp. W4R53]